MYVEKERDKRKRTYISISTDFIIKEYSVNIQRTLALTALIMLGGENINHNILVLQRIAVGNPCMNIETAQRITDKGTGKNHA